MTKIDLKQITEQLNELLGLEENIRVAAMIDNEKDNEIVGWCLTKVDEDGNTTVISKAYNSIKEMLGERLIASARHPVLENLYDTYRKYGEHALSDLLVCLYHGYKEKQKHYEPLYDGDGGFMVRFDMFPEVEGFKITDDLVVQMGLSVDKNIVIRLWYLGHEKGSIERKIMEKYWELFRKTQDAQPKIHQDRKEYITCYEDVKCSSEFTEEEKEMWERFFSVNAEYEKVGRIYAKLPYRSGEEREKLINMFKQMYD